MADTKHITLLAILVLALVDIVTYTVATELGAEVVRWSRPLRPFVIVNFPESRQVRQGFRNIRRTLPEIMNVLCLYFANTAIFALMAFKLFGSRSFGDKDNYFSDFFESFWDMYVLVTTANHPDIMMPAIAQHRHYAIFFICYLIINLYMFMSVFLAVVYNQFRCNLKNEVKESMERSQSHVTKAFEKICDSQGLVTKDRFSALISTTFPRFDKQYIEALWIVMNPDAKDAIAKESFMEILDILKLKYLDLSPRQTLLQTFLPNVYGSGWSALAWYSEILMLKSVISDPSRFLIRVVKHKQFRYLFDVAILINAICIAFDAEGTERYFLTIFSLEIILKVLSVVISADSSNIFNLFLFSSMLLAAKGSSRSCGTFLMSLWLELH